MYIIILRHLICQLCSFQYILEIVCIKSVSEDNCNFVAHHVTTTQLKINIVLPLRLYEVGMGGGSLRAVMCRPALSGGLFIIEHSFCISAASHLGIVCKLLCNLKYITTVHKKIQCSLVFIIKATEFSLKGTLRTSVCCVAKNAWNSTPLYNCT